MRPALGAGIAALLLGVACTGERTPPVPGAELAASVSAHLERTRERLHEETLDHYALVYPIEQESLRAFLAPVQVFGAPGALVLGTAYGTEPHGGGILAFLLEHWRPEGRPVELGDRHRFAGDPPDGTPLAALYDSLKGQVFLPVPARAREEIDGALPDSPQLPRIRFQLPGGAPAEVDAYRFLGLFLDREPDLAATWTNALGQRLSAALLLDHARRYYLASQDTPGEPSDHSNLHLVELLLTASERTGQDPEDVQQHFLATELRRREFDPSDGSLVVAHYAESLGRLVADRRVDWSPAEQEQAREWLAWLEASQFGDLDHEELRRLAHLLLGLRLVDEHRDRLAPGR